MIGRHGSVSRVRQKQCNCGSDANLLHVFIEYLVRPPNLLFGEMLSVGCSGHAGAGDESQSTTLEKYGRAYYLNAVLILLHQGCIRTETGQQKLLLVYWFGRQGILPPLAWKGGRVISRGGGIQKSEHFRMVIR